MIDIYILEATELKKPPQLGVNIMTNKANSQLRTEQDSPIESWNLMTDFMFQITRQQMAAINDKTSALFMCTENVRKVQQNAAYEASQRHSAVAQKMRGDCKPEELMSINFDLLKFTLVSVPRYWQELSISLIKPQFDVIEKTISTANKAIDTDPIREIVKAFEQAIPPFNGYLVSKSNGSNGQDSNKQI